MTAELETARQAAEAGAEVIRRYFASMESAEVRSKAGAAAHDLVTNADLESEQAIAGVIQRAFPDHAILGEETLRADVTAEHLWIVDPLDGTTNFAHHIPHFAVSIAYYRQGRAEAAVVLNPVTRDCHWAVRGQGAWHGDHRCQVSDAERLDQSLVGVGFYYDRGEMMQRTLASIERLFRQQIHGIRRFGTASLDLCFVARGAVGAFFEYELAPWDFAAGKLIVEEAGGLVTDCAGQPLPLDRTSLLASNGKLHAAVCDLVSA